MRTNLTDQEILEQFETGAFPVADFDHSNQVKMAWLFLRRDAALMALQKFVAALKNFAKINGAENLYHETITFAYFFVINERLEQTGREKIWEEFAAANPDLFDWKDNILKKYYRAETLKTDFAKRVFVFPDLLRDDAFLQIQNLKSKI